MNDTEEEKRRMARDYMRAWRASNIERNRKINRKAQQKRRDSNRAEYNERQRIYMREWRARKKLGRVVESRQMDLFEDGRS